MRQILADYDDSGIFVYQAFRPSTVSVAAELGTFGKGFSLDRMTWIKPSFGWMLHRSGYAMKRRQEAIARIKICHEGFLEILDRAVLTSHHKLFGDHAEWTRALKRSEVYCQWDPDRDLRGFKLDHRAIQLGIRGDVVQRYVDEWIMGVEDVTALAHAVRDVVRGRGALPEVPVERVYPLSDARCERLKVTKADL